MSTNDTIYNNLQYGIENQDARSIITTTNDTIANNGVNLTVKYMERNKYDYRGFVITVVNFPIIFTPDIVIKSDVNASHSPT